MKKAELIATYVAQNQAEILAAAMKQKNRADQIRNHYADLAEKEKQEREKLKADFVNSCLEFAKNLSGINSREAWTTARHNFEILAKKAEKTFSTKYQNLEKEYRREKAISGSCPFCDSRNVQMSNEKLFHCSSCSQWIQI